MLRSVGKIFAALVGVGALVGLRPVPTSAAPPSGVSIRLRRADAPAIARELTRALGAPVEVRGGAGRRVTLELDAATPAEALRRVAALLGGGWRMVLHVRSGPAAGGASPAPVPPAPPLPQSLSIGLQDLPAGRAFALVARELGADLDLEGALDRRVALLAVDLPASEVLDRLARQAGAVWWVRFEIEAPDGAIRAKPAPQEPPAPIVLRFPAPATEPPAPGNRGASGMGGRPPRDGEARPPEAEAPSGPELRAALLEGLQQLLRAAPDRRAEAVDAFLRNADAWIGALERLPDAERRARLRHLVPALVQWRRIYRGAAPKVQAQLAPVHRLLESRLRP